MGKKKVILSKLVCKIINADFVYGDSQEKEVSQVINSINTYEIRLPGIEKFHSNVDYFKHENSEKFFFDYLDDTIELIPPISIPPNEPARFKIRLASTNQLLSWYELGFKLMFSNKQCVKIDDFIIKF